jgi:hypothetical protein
MRKLIIIILLSIFLGITGVTTFASDAKKSLDHSLHTGKKIHEAYIQEYQLAYHLLDLPNNSFQHLMVYIADKNGNIVASGKVGFLIKGPDGNEQKVMAMAMKKSFGGNVNFQIKGTYKIKTKVVLEDKKLLDKFSYEVK